MEYRAYEIGLDGHRQSPAAIVAVSDVFAIDQVKQMLNGRPVELWQGSRMVGWFEKIDDQFVGVTASATEPAEATQQPVLDSSTAPT